MTRKNLRQEASFALFRPSQDWNQIDILASNKAQRIANSAPTHIFDKRKRFKHFIRAYNDYRGAVG